MSTPTPPATAPTPPGTTSEFNVLLRLSTPIVVAQVGMMAMGVIDTMMIARVGVEELAAVAIAATLTWAWGSFGQGVIHGMDPMVSQAHGAGDGDAAALALQRGLVVAVLVSIPVGALFVATGWSLEMLGQDPVVADLALTYMLARLPGVLGYHVYVALRLYLAGRTLTRPAMWVMFASNALNVFLNWMLIFGHLGFPPLGLLGAGIGTGITNLSLAVFLGLWIRGFRLHEGAWRRWDRRSFELAGLAQYVRLGIPVGIQMWLEANAFSMGMLMVGWLGVVELAAYQLVLNVASLTFMVPLGISIGAAARVGNLIGAGHADWLERSSRTALAMGGGVMAIAAVCLIVFREGLPRLYIQDAAVIALAATLFPIGGLFQIADGLQVVGSGLMRGMGRPRAGAIANLLGYYVFGLPLGGLLAFHFELRTAGVLFGYVGGLGLVALLLCFWTIRTSRRPLADLRVAIQ